MQFFFSCWIKPSPVVSISLYFGTVCLLAVFAVITNIYLVSLISFDQNLQEEMPKLVKMKLKIKIESINKVMPDDHSEDQNVREIDINT